MLITPASCFLASVIIAAIMIAKAVQFAGGDLTSGRYLGATRQGIGAAIEGLARTLGVGGSVGLSAVLVLASGAWLYVSVKWFRALVAGSK